MFEIIPAIDLLDRQVVRLHKGKYEDKKVYSDNPPLFAESFLDAGANWIHVVDLNAARSGKRDENAEILASIVDRAKGRARVQTGGGIRSQADIEACLALGVSRVIIGTKAARNPEELGSYVRSFGADRVLAGVDVSLGRVRVQGWEEDGGYGTEEFFKILEDQGIGEIVLTNIISDGTLEGVSIPFYQDAVSKTRLRVIVSGGVAGMSDVENLARWNHRAISGMIVGKAYYEGRIDLAEAIQRAQKPQ
ncbi:MAG: 1-(5-phosphoribosyl)-5-[(5-phosphoribosylamino)methylideneamino] imidazole-4-carboxamide isomerase [Leptospirales bacterium]|nr:1-(5-phosphoribosyl)-5-[(5-phosphoribosylamino)methylideneamino] imidazole-4-carboxamide isomerase [Leptospirales bacterium]